MAQSLVFFWKLNKSVWDKEKEPDQMKALVDYLKLKNPKNWY